MTASTREEQTCDHVWITKKTGDMGDYDLKCAKCDELYVA